MSVVSRAARLAQARLEGGRDRGRVDRVCANCGADLVGVGPGRPAWIDRRGETRCPAPAATLHEPRPTTFVIGAEGVVPGAGEQS